VNPDPEFIKAVHRAITVLCEGLPGNKKPTDVTFAAYELGLTGLTPAQIDRAAGIALQRCKFLPPPVELREFVGADGASFEAMAEKAFLTLRTAMQRLGPDYSVNFADGAINATLRLHGGWIRVCELPVEELDKWFRKDFVRTYVGLCRDGCSEDLRRYHGGLLERENAKHDGRTFATGLTYRLGMYGSDVQAIGADYRPALPAPEPKRQIASNCAEYGLQLKQLESK
jgi:hypothetical protein